MNKNTKKLSLNKTTLRAIAVQDLKMIAAGSANTDWGGGVCITPGCTQAPVQGCKHRML
jgi:hypothetical protein